MAERPTVDDLYKAQTISEADLVAAVDAYMADPGTMRIVIGNGYALDLAEAVRAHPFANATISGGNATRSRKRGVIRTAILRARPVKA